MTIASDLAATLLAQLGQDFTVPVPDLTDAEFQIPVETGNIRFDAVAKQTLDDLTTGVVDGDGAFDKIMSANKAHLREQLEKGRISGDQFTKAYIELTTAAMGTALQFVLQGDQSFWQAVTGQSQARKAEVDAVRAIVELETAKQQLALATQQAKTAQAQHALIQMQLSSEDVKFRLTEQQLALVKEQTEAQRAQTLDTRVDGITAVAGTVGAQTALLEQQTTSFKRDVEFKVGKMYLDGWITQKTLDEGLLAPGQLTLTEIDSVLSGVRSKAGLV